MLTDGTALGSGLTVGVPVGTSVSDGGAGLLGGGVFSPSRHTFRPETAPIPMNSTISSCTSVTPALIVTIPPSAVFSTGKVSTVSSLVITYTIAP